MIDKKELQEVIEHASHGNWIPFGIIIGVLSLVVVLLVYIYKMHKKDNDDKHTQADETLKSIAITQLKTELLCERYGIRLDVNDREIRDIKQRIA